MSLTLTFMFAIASEVSVIPSLQSSPPVLSHTSDFVNCEFTVGCVCVADNDCL